VRRTLEFHYAKVYRVSQMRATPGARFARVDSRTERVVVETDRYRVEGLMTLPREGHRSRVSDHVNRRDVEFFTLVDCDLVAIDGSGRDWKAPVLMLARRHIRLIVPASEGA
jgi:hypothetical protein